MECFLLVADDLLDFIKSSIMAGETGNSKRRRDGGPSATYRVHKALGNPFLSMKERPKSRHRSE